MKKNNQWRIRFKVIDKKAQKRHAKSVLTSIDLEVPTEMLGSSFEYIASEIKRIEDERSVGLVL